MGKVLLDMAMSLDGIIAGPNDEYVGLHNWFFSPAGSSADIVDESIRMTGATLMGRRTYDLGVKADGFVNNPYHVPHFVLSHDIPQTVAKGDTTFFFVSQGIEVAIQQAKEVARDKDVVVGGGANIAQQLIKARLLDEMQIHLVPVILGAGIRLFENLEAMTMALEKIKAVESADVTHLRFRVVR